MQIPNVISNIEYADGEKSSVKETWRIRNEVWMMRSAVAAEIENVSFESCS